MPVFLSGVGLWVDWRKEPQLNANILDIMNSLDGKNSIFDVCEKYNLHFNMVFDYVEQLYHKSLISKVREPELTSEN